MKDSIQQLLQLNTKAVLFPVNSRYHGIETATMETVEGKKIIYLRRRLVPPPERFIALQEHTVSQGERLDIIAAQYLNDPRLFWQLCDANGAICPQVLTEAIGSKLRITLPAGIPGIKNG